MIRTIGARGSMNDKESRRITAEIAIGYDKMAEQAVRLKNIRR
jgi:hypothetical protein